MSAVLQENPQELLPTELSITLRPAEVLPFLGQSSSLTESESMVIDSHEMAQIAADERTALAKQIETLKKKKAEFIEPAERIVERAKALFDKPIADREAARTILGRKITDYREHERLRIEEENAMAKAEAERRRQKAEAEAAAERARAEQIAAEKRREAEASEAERKRAEADGDKRKAQAAAADVARRHQEAEAALQTGEAKALQKTQTAAVMTAAPVVAVPPVIAGSTQRDNWTNALKPDVTADQAKQQIVSAIAGGRTDLLGVVKIDEAAICKLAKALKSAMSVPGYVAVNRPIEAGSRR